MTNIFAIMAITMVIVSILANPFYGQVRLGVSNTQIRNATIVTVGLFILSLVIRVFDQIIFV